MKKWTHAQHGSIVDDQLRRICQVTSTDSLSSDERDENARLIAAAPDMLESLLELVCCPAFNGAVFTRDTASHRAWTRAREVILQARGF